MTKSFNFALKIKGVVGRVTHAKSSDPATPSPPKNLESALGYNSSTGNFSVATIREMSFLPGGGS